MSVKITKQREREVLSAYASGMTTSAVAKQLGISQSSVSRVLQRNKVVTRTMSDYPSANRFSTKVELQIIDLYINQQKSTLEIAKVFGTYNTSIRRVLLRYGITPRSGREPQQIVKLEDIAKQVGTQDFDYFLGLLATDGCITGNKVVLEFSEQNRELLDYWNSFLGGKCSVTTSIHKRFKSPQYRIAFRNSDICQFLGKFGITSRKSLTLVLKYINWDVLRGIIDGDGSVVWMNKNTIRVSVTSGSEAFIKQIRNFLELQGIRCHTPRRDALVNPIYELAVYKQVHVLKIYHNLYSKAHFFLKRKKDKFGPLLEKFNSKHSVKSGKE